MTEKVLKDAVEAYENYKLKLSKKIDELTQDIAKETAKLIKKPKKSPAQKKEFKAERRLTRGKLNEVPAVEEAIQTLTAKVAEGEQVPSFFLLLLLFIEGAFLTFSIYLKLPATQLYDLQPTREVLSELIDKWEGATVNDQKIFREHAAR